MFKKFKKFIALLSAVMCVFTVLAGCGGGGGGDDVELDEEGNVRPGSSVTQITFWGYGEDVEKEVFERLVTAFNAENEGVIKVNYVQKPPGGYEDALKTTLGGNRPPDVFYVADAQYKMLADLDYLMPLDDYILGTDTRAASKEIVPGEMWPSSVNRYRYDVKTTTMDGPDAKYWGVPKDIGPTVVYYNETFFNQAGIKVISVAKEDLTAFNGGAKDARGKTKTEYNINGTVGEYGYFVDGSGQKWFNNQIPMSWNENVECANVVQSFKGINATTQAPNVYGYFTEWWFNYGWSVGGDCIQYVPTTDAAYNGGYWEFTIMDDTKNYIVADNNTDGFTIGEKTYMPGEIITWQDKLVDIAATAKTVKPAVIEAKNNGKLVELPSQREAFVEFVRIGQKSSVEVETGLNGYGICPSPTSIGGDSGKTTAFATGKVVMLVDGRWNVPDFRTRMDGTYDWDVAPLPVYRSYNNSGFGTNRTVTARGIEAGHSGSMALSISKKSKYANAAWKFIEYIGGKTGQIEQSKTGFAIPSQIESANDETIFLQSTQNPKNSRVFLRAAANQTPGDWWYLYDKAWIDPWAGVLNGDVRNGVKTLTQFEQSKEFKDTNGLLRNYTKK